MTHPARRVARVLTVFSWQAAEGSAGDSARYGRNWMMARLTPIIGENQMDARDHAAVDAIVQSRGAIREPFIMFFHYPELARRVKDLGAFVRFEGSPDTPG